MRIRAALLAAMATSTVLTSAGCALSGNQSEGPACSSQTFDVNRNDEPLGTSQQLVKAFRAAADQQLEFTTMAEMVARAGWSPGWDRMVYLVGEMTDEELKQATGADLEMACFTGLPGRSSNSDYRSPHMTLFLLDGKPLQAELWSDQNPSLRFNGKDYLTPETVVRFDPGPGVMVAE